tara:strand:- start:1908 stop:2471 length:564 start_codon:yes stop_codon:yes gene_type:complete
VSRFDIPAFGQIGEKPFADIPTSVKLVVVGAIMMWFAAPKKVKVRANPDEEDEARFKVPNIKDPPYLTPKEKKERLAWLGAMRETGVVIGDDPDWIITDDKTMEEFLRSWSGSDEYGLMEAYGYDDPVEEQVMTTQSFTPAVLQTRGGKSVGIHVPILRGKSRGPLRLSRETGQGVPEANPRRRKKR